MLGEDIYIACVHVDTHPFAFKAYTDPVALLGQETYDFIMTEFSKVLSVIDGVCTHILLCVPVPPWRIGQRMSTAEWLN